MMVSQAQERVEGLVIRYRYHIVGAVAVVLLLKHVVNENRIRNEHKEWLWSGKLAHDTFTNSFGEPANMLSYNGAVCNQSIVIPKAYPTEPDVKICVEHLKPPCNVLSFGVAYIFDFEETMLAQGCRVWSFDPSMRRGTYRRGKHHQFRHLGIGTVDGEHIGESSISYYNPGRTSYQVITLATILKDIVKENKIDVLRIDVEGAEWPIIKSWLDAGYFRDGIIKQLLFEAHFDPSYTHYSEEESNQVIVPVIRDLAKEMKLFWADPNKVRNLPDPYDEDLIYSPFYELGMIAP